MSGDYVSARTRSKARIELNKAIIGKAHEEGGDLTSSESLASAFLMLSITENPASALLTFEEISEPDIEIMEKIRESEAEKEPATYMAALQSP